MGHSTVLLHLFQCNTTAFVLYWAPLYFSRAVKKYLGDSVFIAWPWRWRQRKCGKFKSRKSICVIAFMIYVSQSQRYSLLELLTNIHCHNNKKRSRNAQRFSGRATHLTVCVCHTCSMQNHLQNWTNSHGCEQWKWCLLCKQTATLILLWHVLPTQPPQLPCR